MLCTTTTSNTEKGNFIMKKLTICVAAALAAALTTSVQAQEAPPYESWVGGFAQYYGADIEKIEPVGGLNDGRGFGLEGGFRFDPSWAIRFELGRLLIDNDKNDPLARDEDGTLLGVDAMYFLENDFAYFFGGMREQSLNSDNFRMAAAGVGKHWELTDNIRLVTELAAYHDFGESYREYSAKVGLAYVFGVNTTVYNPDSDGDGVNDGIDRCPGTLAGTQVDATGCAIDMDNDGVLNAQDECPMTPADSVVDARGCVVGDADNDGVLDNVDKCLNTPTNDKVGADGCSLMEKREVSVALNMLFANNSSVVANPDSARIQEFAAFMEQYPTTEAVIEGHSSAVGETDYNQMLSEKRANAVRTLLIEEYGIDGTRLQTVGYGETRLKSTANTAEASRLNRRIEVKVSTLVDTNVNR